MKARAGFVLIAAVGAAIAHAQHPNVNRGFEADKVYQFGQVDSVNLYNGNLNLSLPLGGGLGGNGTLRYQFGLVYNSKNWDYEIKNYNCPAGHHPLCVKDYKKAVPTRYSNAGMGWLFSLGRLYTTGDVYDPWGPPYGPVYLGPDGAAHDFLIADPADPNVRYTADGSFLKLVSSGGSPAQSQIHFPDGTVHYFQKLDQPYTSLWQIRDPFGNRVEIDYTATQWILKEYEAGGSSPIRTHSVTIKDISADADLKPKDAPWNYNFVVDTLDLAAYDGTRAHYRFEYATETIDYGCYGDHRDLPGYIETPDPKVPRLKRVVRPDGSAWEMDYYSGMSADSQCAAVKTLTFPTKGTITWKYGTYVMPTQGCSDDPEPTLLAAPYAMSDGVRSKTVADPVTGTAGTWTYTQSSDDPGAGGFFSCWGISSLPKSRWTKTTIVRPDANKSEHYFSLVPWSAQLEGEAALPYTRSESAVPGEACDAPEDLCLSSVEYDCSGGSCVRKRSRYVRYEGEHRVSFFAELQPPQYRREVESLTVFHEDGNRSVRTKRSEYDGLGHFRLTRTEGSWSAAFKEERTTYNPGKPAVTVDPVTWANTPSNNRPAQGWQLSLFDTRSVWDGAKTVRSELDFDAQTGFLKRRRDYAGLAGGRSSNDTIAAYDRKTQGNVTLESYYGGDRQAVGTGTLSTLTLPAVPEYRVQHEYSYGTRRSSAYLSASGSKFLQLFDATIDANTGAASSIRDASDVTTTYGFDAMGRITSLSPAGAAPTTYAYAAGAPPHTAIMETTAAAGTVSSRFELDGFGRVIRTKTLMLAAAGAPGEWSVVDVQYDALGRKTGISEPYAASQAALPVFTVHAYDWADRLAKVTSPDGSISQSVYRGSRERDRISAVGLVTGPANVTVTERYDPLGRLVAVVEPSGPNGASVTTGYSYDVGDRLTRVIMAGTEGSQVRDFVYDGLGRLREEGHPEMARTYHHDYDSRGHALSRSMARPAAGGDSAPTPQDLRFTFDKGERLLSVKMQHPGMASRSLLELKAFTYAGSNEVVSGQTNYTKGKLLTATRWNYAPDPLRAEEDVYIVTERYAYLDAAGRRTNRTTTIDRSVEGDVERVRSIEQHVAYNDLSLPERIDYPTCVYCTFSGTKAVLSSYSAGRLRLLSRINSANASMEVAEIGYFPNGMAKSILHVNQVRDTIELDDTTMARPKRIRFEPWQRCTQPAWAGIEASPGWSVAPGQPVTLTATYGPSTASAPISFHWSVVEANGAWTPVGGSTAVLTVSPAGTTTYVVRVENPCQSADSAPATIDGPAVAEAMATVTVSGCEAPAIDTEPPVALSAQPGAPVTLSVTALGTQPLSYAWYALDQPSVVLGTDRTLTIASIARTTRFACRITNACGQVTSGTAVVSVPLPAPASLTATRSAPQAIALSWTAAAGAHHYNVERMTGGGAFAQIGTATQTTFTDQAVTIGVTYVYRVIAAAATAGSESVSSNRELATMMAFQGAVPGSPVDDGYFHELLAALNALHAANGWPAATWASILPPGVPSPGPGVVVRAAHLAALRDHMNLARQALGVPSGSYADDPIVSAVTPIRAAQITAVQQRAQ